MFTCIETPSAPIFRAFCTVFTSTLWLGSGASIVLADRCRMSPISRPPCRWPCSARPTCPITAFAPPSATRFTVCPMSIRPGMGPFVTPWSIGTMTVFFVLRFMIRSRRISFPLIVTTTPPSSFAHCYANSEGLPVPEIIPEIKCEFRKITAKRECAGPDGTVTVRNFRNVFRYAAGRRAT